MSADHFIGMKNSRNRICKGIPIPTIGLNIFTSLPLYLWQDHPSSRRREYGLWIRRHRLACNHYMMGVLFYEVSYLGLHHSDTTLTFPPTLSLSPVLRHGYGGREKLLWLRNCPHTGESYVYQ